MDYSFEVDVIRCGKSEELLSEYPDDVVDLVVTDPPYGLEFMGFDWDRALPPRGAIRESYRVLKPGGIAFLMCSPRQDLQWRMLRLLEETGFVLTQSQLIWVYKTGFPKAYDLAQGIERKYYSEGLAMRTLFGEGTSRDGEPYTDEAKRWDGWKNIAGLKPAYEPILMVYKPLSESTIVENVLRWGTGAINVDACRIPYQDEKPIKTYGLRKGTGISLEWSNYESPDNFQGKTHTSRFPANLLVSDRALDTGEITKSGKYEKHHNFQSTAGGHVPANVYGKYKRLAPEDYPNYADSGDQSRYFDLDAWAEHHGILDVPKPSSSEREKGLNELSKKVMEIGDERPSGKSWERRDKKQTIPRANTHPTVKPIQLMAYLVTLGSSQDALVLDPFVGSGTTAIACKQLNRRYIGIDMKEKYCRIAEARIRAYPSPLEYFFGE